jgi:phospholipid N-methyltransferase
MGALTYIKNFFGDPNVASVAPTSAAGVARVLDKMQFGPSQVFVEYGPGGGVFTKALLERMTADSKIIAIEQNQNFVNALRKEFSDPRLEIIQGSAENVLPYLEERGLNGADYILSGIPFSLFPVDLKDRILRNTRSALKTDGRFFVYQFLISLSGPKNDISRKLREHLEIVCSEVEMRCIPPLRIYESKVPSNPK